jgi:hypothetical protein
VSAGFDGHGQVGPTSARRPAKTAGRIESLVHLCIARDVERIISTTPTGTLRLGGFGRLVWLPSAPEEPV